MHGVLSVKLFAGDGRKVTTARLGQSAGMRSARYEVSPNNFMDEMDDLSGDQGMPGSPLLGAPAVVMATSAPRIDIDLTHDLAVEG